MTESSSAGIPQETTVVLRIDVVFATPFPLWLRSLGLDTPGDARHTVTGPSIVLLTTTPVGAASIGLCSRATQETSQPRSIDSVGPPETNSVASARP